ncbi:MAG: hypothetical protein U1F68_21065 [Gammaproteobacteria bacterium]
MLAEEGRTQEEIGRLLGVARETVRDWFTTNGGTANSCTPDQRIVIPPSHHAIIERAQIARELFEPSGFAFETCKNAGTVSRAFRETSRRRDLLSWTHHQYLTSLDSDTADELLDWCEEPYHASGGKTAPPSATTNLRANYCQAKSRKTYRL